ncbi:hypothetical protein [Halomonas sp. A3H3]|uniref:hypothetical protein n=1 Tax=Halomonas sp. A3H3 TaxID=1346287 RepID=UPI00130E075C|nr:hypothetical protein [Halomonas sp. A3H3]
MATLRLGRHELLEVVGLVTRALLNPVQVAMLVLQLVEAIASRHLLDIDTLALEAARDGAAQVLQDRISVLPDAHDLSVIAKDHHEVIGQDCRVTGSRRHRDLIYHSGLQHRWLAGSPGPRPRGHRQVDSAMAITSLGQGAMSKVSRVAAHRSLHLLEAPFSKGLLLMLATGGEAGEAATLDPDLIEAPHGVAVVDSPPPQVTQLSSQAVDDALGIVGDGARPILIDDHHQGVADERDLVDGL